MHPKFYTPSTPLQELAMPSLGSAGIGLFSRHQKAPQLDRRHSGARFASRSRPVAGLDREIKGIAKHLRECRPGRDFELLHRLGHKRVRPWAHHHGNCGGYGGFSRPWRAALSQFAS